MHVFTYMKVYKKTLIERFADWGRDASLALATAKQACCCLLRTPRARASLALPAAITQSSNITASR